MSRLRLVVCVSMLVLSFGSQAQAQQPPAQPPAQQPPPSDLWEQLTIGLGFQLYSGDQDAVAFGVNVDWSEQFRRIELELSGNANVTHAKGDTTHHAESMNWALRWLAEGRTDSRLYPMVHIWYQHDEVAGVDLRATGGAGVGSHLMETTAVKLTLEGGVGATTERLTGAADKSYASLFVVPRLQSQLGQRAMLKSHLLTELNASDGGDVRLQHQTDFNVQITPRVGLQNSLIVSYDREPVPGHQPTNVQMTVNVAFSLTRGTPRP